MNKIALISLGCSKNSVDSELMFGFLQNNGFIITNNYNEADLIIINTCGFIKDAKEESIEVILNAVDSKSPGGKPYVLVAGCLSQRYGSELLTEIPEIDGVMGVNEISNVVHIVNRIIGGEKVKEISEKSIILDDYSFRLRFEKTPFAYIKLAEGCNNRCSYCAIPFIKGPYKSRTMKSIIYEVRVLAEQGVKEIILVAQETTRYGLDLYGEYKLADLLCELSRVDGIEWIRVLYCYPESITGDLIETINREDKICNYIDLPLQHVNNRVLRRMNRRGSKEDIINLINNIRSNIKNVILRTTFIIGFPSETENDFRELLEFIKEIQFERAGFFSYSDEEGTPAANLTPKISEEVKQARMKEAALLQEQISYDKNKEKTGKEYEVLVEGFDNNYKMYIGRTRADAPEVDGQVFFYSSKNVNAGSIVKIFINDADEYDLTGELHHEFT
ncbi:MAG: 30S ribosomal protein S12 methylthiotransferase RimO [Clostridiales bacterium]|nr:30S ribosomal protein S12 methylthiotransferase RimO [Clostridiales bacterium]MCF8023412.1 30S ribosomal protein S12 methylthiotransferase RimO [Clostridiales bacterium]